MTSGWFLACPTTAQPEQCSASVETKCEPGQRRPGLFARCAAIGARHSNLRMGHGKPGQHTSRSQRSKPEKQNAAAPRPALSILSSVRVATRPFEAGFGYQTQSNCYMNCYMNQERPRTVNDGGARAQDGRKRALQSVTGRFRQSEARFPGPESLATP